MLALNSSIATVALILWMVDDGIRILMADAFASSFAAAAANRALLDKPCLDSSPELCPLGMDKEDVGDEAAAAKGRMSGSESRPRAAKLPMLVSPLQELSSTPLSISLRNNDHNTCLSCGTERSFLGRYSASNPFPWNVFTAT